MRRLSTLALAALLLPGAALLPSANASCDEAVCFTDEEARQGGDCEAWDEQDADHNRYYNLTITAGEAQVDARSRFGCENLQYRGVSAEWDDMYTTLDVKTPGRTDRVVLLYSYGNMRYGCSAGIVVDPDRTLLFDFREGVGTYEYCGQTEPVPSVAEALP